MTTTEILLLILLFFKVCMICFIIWLMREENRAFKIYEEKFDKLYKSLIN